VFAFLEPLREVTMFTVTVRMMLAVVCGGLIGIEREYKRRPAGFRTHILICLGASMTTLTSQYLYLNMLYFTDMGRLGAQVIAGIGFIGAGAIIVTRRRRVKGLTTAAGLWTAAIVGLACGAGFYEGAVYTTVLILLAELVFSKLEYRMMAKARETNLYVEYSGNMSLDHVIRHFRDVNIKITDLEITRASDEKHNACAIFTLQMNRRTDYEKMLGDLSDFSGIIAVEEL